MKTGICFARQTILYYATITSRGEKVKKGNSAAVGLILVRLLSSIQRLFYQQKEQKHSLLFISGIKYGQIKIIFK